MTFYTYLYDPHFTLKHLWQFPNSCGNFTWNGHGKVITSACAKDCNGWTVQFPMAQGSELAILADTAGFGWVPDSLSDLMFSAPTKIYYLLEYLKVALTARKDGLKFSFDSLWN